MAKKVYTDAKSALDGVLRGAKAGDTVVLSPGGYGVVTIKARAWPRPLTLDAHAARLTGIVLIEVDGLVVGKETREFRYAYVTILRKAD